ncbi:hypothetical protein MML48_1g03977 [Holotrichia oblita]|uniref:Uncharacterized protein n=1 Tax=Holotrichia oblita TaxID=644536 RepID=A0ACB9TUK1_HOLOL|nr:hypothetical protein MML48_1g03977 [Holotrichia oblita]
MIFRLAVLGASLVSFLLTYYKQKKHEEKMVELQQQQHKVEDDVWYKFIFITNENSGCTEHLRQEESCGDKCSHNYLQTIRQHVRSAKASISLCIYHVTLATILQELTEAHSRQIVVRVISDREMDYHHASITKKLKEKGKYHIHNPV